MSSASVLTVINLKGGVGKTHTAWLLASVCHERGQRLLVIDTDPQANLTGSLLDEPGEMPGIEALFDPAQDGLGDDLIRPSRLQGVDIIPSCAALMHFDLADQVQWEQTDLHFSLVEQFQRQFLLSVIRKDRVAPKLVLPLQSLEGLDEFGALGAAEIRQV